MSPESRGSSISWMVIIIRGCVSVTEARSCDFIWTVWWTAVCIFHNLIKHQHIIGLDLKLVELSWIHEHLAALDLKDLKICFIQVVAAIVFFVVLLVQEVVSLQKTNVTYHITTEQKLHSAHKCKAKSNSEHIFCNCSRRLATCQRTTPPSVISHWPFMLTINELD